MVEQNKKEFLTSKYDRVFKAVFLNSNDTDHLLDQFLEKLLSLPVEKVELKGTELPITNVGEKVKVVDGLIKVNEHTNIHIENDTKYDEGIRRRNFGYLASIYDRNIERGGRIDLRERFLLIDFNFTNAKQEQVIDYYQIMNKNGKKYIKNLVIMTYNIEKVREFWYNRDIKNIKKYKYLIMLDLNEKELEELKEIVGRDEIIMEYTKRVTELNDEERYRPWLSMEEKQEVTENMIRQEAMKKGEAKGERREKTNVARNMLRENMDISTITRVTGLSEKAIQRLSV